MPPTNSTLCAIGATPRLICFNKPYGVLSQFTAEGRWRGLKDFIDLPGVYVAERLNADSEDLVLLTSDEQFQVRELKSGRKPVKAFQLF